MLFYMHLVWTLDLTAFFGPQPWLSVEALQKVHLAEGSNWAWSHLQLIQAPWAVWIVHLAALTVFLMFALGLFSRTTAVLSYLLAVSYLNRISLAEFGLDRITVMLAMYVMLGPCGARYSLDRWWRRRRGLPVDDVPPSTAANIAIRLIQVHLCVIYFFAGTRKLMGGSWWDGSAMWLSVANLEYQTLDLTWMARWPLLVTFLTHLTVWFELGYAALIWPRLTRPIMLMLAVLTHLGIALALGMPTFGLAMLIANGAFLSPGLVRGLLEPRWRKSLAPQPA
ncbi:MAG: HTTM domain-containing protein [Planctomycetia bacterium]|nr:HTTM domain-containing protein [Planctomycetia bacterium]